MQMVVVWQGTIKKGKLKQHLSKNCSNNRVVFLITGWNEVSFSCDFGLEQLHIS